MTELLHLDATGQAELVRRGDISATELLDTSIAAVEKLNPELNAVIHERFDKARREVAAGPADGPFAGVPYVHKDHDGSIAGEPLHHSCNGLKSAGYVSDHDSNMAARLRSAGLVCIGKTNLPEFGLQPTTESEAYGPAHNPWDTTRTTGGSSGGSAAAVASRMVAVGSAGDGGGSIRWPASACGLVGLKTTRGRISLAPTEGESWGGLVVQGFLSRSVRDTAALLDITAGREAGDPYNPAPPARPYADELRRDPGALRVGLMTTAPGAMATTQPEIAATIEATGQMLEALGHHVEEAFPAAMLDPARDITPDFTNIYTVFVDNDLRVWGRAIGKERLEEGDVELGTWTLAEIGREIDATTYYHSWENLRAASREIQSWWEVDGWDVLVTPACPELPPTLGQFGSPPDNPMQGMFRSAGIVPFLAPFNVTGQPGISLPLHWSDGDVPIGVQFVGGYGREDQLIGLAAQLEAAHPWADRWPAVSA